MNDALIFLLRALVDLYLLALLLRLLLQAVRADFYNPVSQFIVRITDPVTAPLRRVLPAAGRLDIATLVVLVALQIGATAMLIAMGGFTQPDPAALLYFALLRLAMLVLRLYFFAILIYVILSWVGRDLNNPVVRLLAAVVEPLLAPVRRVLPSVGGLDLSPLVVLLLLQALMIALPLPGLLR